MISFFPEISRSFRFATALATPMENPLYLWTGWKVVSAKLLIIDARKDNGQLNYQFVISRSPVQFRRVAPFISITRKLIGIRFH